MENLKCLKCKNNVICKFKDSLNEVEEKFPFIESFTCKFYETPVKKTQTQESAQLKEKVENAPKPRGRKKANTSEEPESVKPAPVKSEPKQAKPKNTGKIDDDFKQLPISSLNFKNNISSALNGTDFKIVADLYDKKKTKTLPKAIIDEINYVLLIFNQPTI